MSNSFPLPARPSSVLSEFGHQIQAQIEDDIKGIITELSNDDRRREAIKQNTQIVFRNVAKILFSTRIGSFESVDALMQETSEAVTRAITEASSTPTGRDGSLANAIEKFTEVRLLRDFFSTGRLSSFAQMQPCRDEEYLGACLGFAQELAQYCVGRAVADDANSIAICRTLLVEMMTQFLEFDFRNGNLRRKYDGLKYALRRVEDVTYEMVINASPSSVVLDSVSSPPHKKQKVEGPFSFFPPFVFVLFIIE